MATRSAELWRLHVFNGPISDLRADEDIQKSGYAEEPGQALQSLPAIDHYFGQSLANLSLAEIDPDGDQNQAGEENRRKNEENDYSNVRVGDVPANL
jgi:hypothetical protein